MAVSQVAGWLEKEGFGNEWQAAFAANEIDGEALKLLKDPVWMYNWLASLLFACMSDVVHVIKSMLFHPTALTVRRGCH
jgi:hypothetical protein